MLVRKKDAKIILSRDRDILTFFIVAKNKKVTYNLTMMSMYNNDGICVQHQHQLLQYININEIYCREKHFRELVMKSREVNSSCQSLSTFIARLSNVLVYENFITQGVKYSINSSYYGYNRRTYDHFKHKLEEYTKFAIKFVKKYDFTITNSFEEFYFPNKRLSDSILQIIDTLDIDNENKKEILKTILGSYHFSPLIKEHGYDTRSLIKYCTEYLKPFENIEFNKGLELLNDYYRMAKVMGRNVKRYPKYLRSMHDIITANYNSYKQKYDEKLFKQISKPELEYQGKKFCIVVPKISKDVVCEGTSLNHCVSSYIDKILKKETYIFFLRKAHDQEQPLVTLELIDNKIIAYKGAYNRKTTTEETEFLKKYANKMGLMI